MRSLDAMLSIDEVIQVWDEHVFRVRGIRVPEAMIATADDDCGSILDEHEQALIADFRRQGWELETGWTSQQGNHRRSPLMHPSEYVGGPLEEHIRETPGLWVAVAVYAEGDGQPTGYWAIAHRESTDGAEQVGGPVRWNPAPAGYDRVGLPLGRSPR